MNKKTSIFKPEELFEDVSKKRKFYFNPSIYHGVDADVARQIGSRNKYAILEILRIMGTRGATASEIEAILRKEYKISLYNSQLTNLLNELVGPSRNAFLVFRCKETKIDVQNRLQDYEKESNVIITKEAKTSVERLGIVDEEEERLKKVKTNRKVYRYYINAQQLELWPNPFVSISDEDEDSMREKLAPHWVDIINQLGEKIIEVLALDVEKIYAQDKALIPASIKEREACLYCNEIHESGDRSFEAEEFLNALAQPAFHFILLEAFKRLGKKYKWHAKMDFLEKTVNLTKATAEDFPNLQ